MRKYILYCGKTEIKNFDVYDSICVLSLFSKASLEKQNVKSKSLNEISLPVSLRHKSIRLIDHSLILESENNEEVSFIPLLFRDIYLRYSLYVQYKYRLEKWLSNGNPDSLYVTSGDDKYLIQAAKDVCRSYHIDLLIGNGVMDVSAKKITKNSELEILFSPFIFDFDWFIKIKAVFIKFVLNKKVLYQKYWNIKSEANYVGAFSLANSILFLDRLIQKFFKRKYKYLEREPITLTRNYWGDISREDFLVISNIINELSKSIPREKYDIVKHKLSLYFKTLNPENMIILHDHVSLCRLISYICKKNDIHVDYLPHGIVNEDYSLSTENSFSPNRVLAWNNNSKDLYKRYGVNSVTVAHPVNSILSPKELKRMKPSTQFKVLILLPENEEYGFRHDSFEHDLIVILSALKKQNLINYVDVKHHPTQGEYKESRLYLLNKVEELLNFELNIVDSNSKASEIMESYNLVFLGSTTGILEVMNAGVPFIIFNSQMPTIGSLKDFLLPIAETENDIIELMDRYDYELYEREIIKVFESLKVGENPFKVSF